MNNKQQKFMRWYDKDPQLKTIINFLEKAPDEMRNDVAMDLIQIIVQEDFTTSDELITFAKSNYIGSGQRWYDIDELVHTAIEMIKLLNDDERRVVLSEVAQTILHISAHQREYYE
ncbi:MAG: hypothetical protein AB1782_06915 [Cyanobacteriota bacterium]